MFKNASRYYGLETAIFTTSEGREIAYKRRRFLPSVASDHVLAEHTVTEGERLDCITAKYLGDPEMFWQLCDANNAMHPDELTEEISRKIRVALPSI